MALTIEQVLQFKNHINEYDDVDTALEYINDKYLKPIGKGVNFRKAPDNKKLIEFRKKINGILNKLNESNYDIIKKQLLDDGETDNLLQTKQYLNIFVNILHKKILIDIYYIDIYIKIIKSIVLDKIYNIPDDNINFRILFVNRLEQNYTSRNIDDKKDNINNIIILSEMYNNKIIAKHVILNIINELKDSTKSLDLELLYNLLKYTKLYVNYKTFSKNLTEDKNIETRIRMLYKDFI